MISSGTGRPMIHPATKICLRPIRSLIRPANRFASAFVTPNVTMNERSAVCEVRPNHARQERNNRPLQADHAAYEGVDEHQQRKLLPVGLRPSGSGPRLGSQARWFASACGTLLHFAACLAPVVYALGDQGEVLIPATLQH